jgi:hypothetical protein
MSDEFDGLDAMEEAGVGATLNRCRVLAAKIANELRNRRPEHFVDTLLLADVHASLERAADVLSTGGLVGAGDVRVPNRRRASRTGRIRKACSVVCQSPAST